MTAPLDPTPLGLHRAEALSRRGEKFMTPREVAGRWRVSPMTVYRMIHDGELRAIRVGRSYRVLASAVITFERTADTWNQL